MKPALVRIIQNPPAVYPRVIIKFQLGPAWHQVTTIAGADLEHAIANVRRARRSALSPLAWIPSRYA